MLGVAIRSDINFLRLWKKFSITCAKSESEKSRVMQHSFLRRTVACLSIYLTFFSFSVLVLFRVKSAMTKSYALASSTL